MPVAPETVLEQLKWRYATKKFDPAKKIEPELWAKLEAAAIHAPSSFGLQPWTFVVVTDPDVRKKLHPVSYNQPQVLDCSHLVVFAAKNPPTPADVDAYVTHTAVVRGTPVEAQDGLKGGLLGALSRMDAGAAHRWAARQTYIALGVFLSACALAGVDACPMEGFQTDQYDQILGLNDRGLKSVVMAAAGYRSADDKYASLPKVRFDAKDVVIRV